MKRELRLLNTDRERDRKKHELRQKIHKTKYRNVIVVEDFLARCFKLTSAA